MSYVVLMRRCLQMNLQTIKSIQGKAEYVLLPVFVYRELHDQIEKKLKKLENQNDYVSFNAEDYISNPIALARIKANITQQTLARRMNVTQAYISKIEKQEKITPKLLARVKAVLSKG